MNYTPSNRPYINKKRNLKKKLSNYLEKRKKKELSLQCKGKNYMIII